jgi:predicted nucleotidyltransferase
MSVAALQLPLELDELRRILKKHGVIAASVFGSFARGEAREESDLDLLVQVQPGISAFDLVDLQAELEGATHRKVDLTTKLHPRFEPYITPDLTPIL